MGLGFRVMCLGLLLAGPCNVDGLWVLQKAYLGVQVSRLTEDAANMQYRPKALEDTVKHWPMH